MKLPVVFARKKQPITMAPEPFKEEATSPTKGGKVELIVSTEYLTAHDHVLIIDDFLASANTILALEKLVNRSGAKLVGIGAVIEKEFQGGRKLLEHLTIPIESLAVIERFDGDTIVLQPSKQSSPA